MTTTDAVPSAPGRPTRVIVLVWRTDLHDGNDRILLLVAYLRRRGIDASVLAVTGGPERRRFRRTAPTFVANRWERLVAIARTLHLAAITTAIKRVRLRRWLRARADAVFLVHHPGAMGLLAYLPGGADRLVASLPTAGWTLDDLPPATVPAFRAARAWLVASSDQREAIRHRFEVPVEELGAVVDPEALPHVHRGPPGRGAVVLVGATDAWTRVDPTVEVLYQLRRRRPDLPLRWLVTGDDARWLARHDIEHAGLEIDVVTVDEPSALDGIGVLVRAVDEAANEPAVIAATLARVPLIDRHGPDRPASDGAQLDVEGLVTDVDRLLTDPAGAARRAEAALAGLATIDLENRGAAVLAMLSEVDATSPRRAVDAPVQRLRLLVRAPLWFTAKLLPLVAAAELAALTAGTPAALGLPRMAAMLTSAVAVAAGAHLVNDLADRASDRAAGKRNQLEHTSPAAPLALLALCAIGTVAPWLVVPLEPAAAAILGALVLLSVAYSVPPTRLKGRAGVGIAADAFVAHTLPIAFAFVELGGGGQYTSAWWFAAAAAATWATGFGIRNIVVHQVLDAAGDRAAGVQTFVVARGIPWTVRKGRDAFGVEVAGLIALWFVTLTVAWGAAAFFLVHLALWLHHRRFDHRPIDTVPSTAGAWLPLAEFYEVWPALAFGVALANREPQWGLVVMLVAVVFWPAVHKQLLDELALIGELVPDVWRRWVVQGVAPRVVSFWRGPVHRTSWRLWSLIIAGGWRARNAITRSWWTLYRAGWRAWNAVTRSWWAVYRAHWHARHAVADPIVNFSRRQGRRVRWHFAQRWRAR